MENNTVRIRRSFDRRRFLASTVATAAVSSAPIGAAFGKQLKRSKVAVGIGADWGTSGHAVIAYQKGFFEAEGLDIELKYFPAGALQVEALAARAIDVCNPTQAPVISLRAAGYPVVILSSLTEYHDSHVLIVAQSKNVTAPKQLEGLKIGLLKGSSIELMMDTLVSHYGIDGSLIETVNLAPPQAVAGMASGAVDGICVWQPWVHQAMQKVPSSIVHTGAHSHFEQNKGEGVRVDFTRAVLATSQFFTKDHPETVNALMRAYANAQAFIEDSGNFDEVVKIFSEYHQQDIEVNSIILKDPVSTLALDENYVNDISMLQDFLLRSGRIKSKVDLKQLTWDEALSNVDRRWVTMT